MNSQSISSLSTEDAYALGCLNKYLIRTTGIDFLKKLVDFGNDEKKTEIDAKNFIKANYPVKTGLTKKDIENLALLESFYILVLNVHDSADRAVTFGDCEPKKTPWEDNFRARSMTTFLQNKSPFEKSCASAFFPLS